MMAPGDLDLRLNEQFRTLFEVGSLGTLSDRQLLDRFGGGGAASEPAFGMLVERHGPMVMGVCRRLLADPHLAEDAFQATFLVLARRSGTVRNRDCLGGWLHRVAHRVALRLRGRNDRRKARERPEVEEVAVNEDDRLQCNELRAVIDEEIDRLGDAQRLPVVLCCLEGLSHEEAAHQLDWPLGTVKSRLARGRRRLQDRLLRRGFAPAVAAGSTALLGNEASAAVAPALVEATARGAATIAARGLVAGAVPATALALVREELASMIAFKLKLAAAGSLAVGGFAVLVGFALAAGPGPEAPPDVATRKNEEPKAVERDPNASSGLVLTGRVVDASSGKGVAKVLVSYVSHKANEPSVRAPAGFRVARLEPDGTDRDPLTSGLQKETDSTGQYRLVVPGGRGTLVLRTIPAAFAQPTQDLFRRIPDPKFSREINGQVGQTIEVADFSLVRSRSVWLHVVDAEGQPVANAQVDIRDRNRRRTQDLVGKTDAQGRYEVTELQPQQATTIDVTAMDRRLGGLIDVPDVESGGGQAPASLAVRLQPLVTLSGRVLDAEGKPLAVEVLHLYRSVSFPGQSGWSFSRQVATLKQIDRDGSYSFDQLIAGATYYTHVEARGHATATSQHVTARRGQPLLLRDFRLPVTDQEVNGIVVDPRGKPLDKVVVSHGRTEPSNSPLYPPAGAIWFHETDGSGRFHLVGLPRGPVRLMVYRNPAGPDRQIRNMKYVDVNLGQNEVRVELPDPNDRLRGID
jgi:RNA polymerase sigma factor (sigma-70 family)